jgi:hypothetical protein
MEYILIVYSCIITILFAAVWFQNNNLFKEILKEREHSQDLRKTILSYLKNK